MIVAVLGLLMSLNGCGDDDPPPGPAPEVVDDARRLSELIGSDPAIGPLEEVERVVDDDLPVRAAELLEAGAIPAAERQVERVRALEPEEPRVRRLRDRAVAAYEARVEALELYRAALARGPVEDLTLIEALGAQREAEAALLEVIDDVHGIAPPREGEGEVQPEVTP